MRYHKKFGTTFVRPFVRLLDTNKQTDKSTNQPKILIANLLFITKTLEVFFNSTFTQENFPDLVDLNLLFCIVYFDQPCLNQRVRSANNKNLYL